MNILKILLPTLLCAAWLAAAAQTPPAAAPKAITVVLDDNYPPYIFRDADGQLQGILKDSWALWQQRTGIQVNLQAMDWQAAQQVMKTDQADVIDTMFMTPARLPLYDFTPPYASIKVSLYFHRSIGGIVDARSARGFTIGVKDGDACIDVLTSQGVTEFKRFSSYSAVVAAAETGELRVFCMDQPPAAYLLNQTGMADEFRYTQPISVGEFHRAVGKGNTALLATLTAGFAAISEQQLKQIEEKWLGQAVNHSRYWRYAAQAALLVAVLGLALVLWNLMLRRRVHEKTRSLTDSLAALEQTHEVLEQALMEQKAMLDNDMVGIVKVADRQVIWANPAFAAMFGYTPDELAGQSTRLYYTSDEAWQRLADAAYPAMAAGKVYRTRWQFVHRSGAAIWVELSGAMLPGERRESLWIFLDVSEQRNSGLARDEALTRLQKLAERVPGLVYQYLLRPDGSSCFPFASGKIRDIYRISPQEAQVDAAGVFAVLHPADFGAVATSIQDSAQQLTPWQHEYRVRYDDGTVRWLFGNALPERQDDGSTLWHGFITDITERKAVDERLRQLSRSVEQAPVAIVITNLDGSILYANPRFTRNTGYTLDEALGQNPRILKSGLTPPETYVELWDTVSQGQVWQGELHNRRKNGELFIERAVIAPVQGVDGQTTHYVAVKEDITQRKQADLALQASLQEKVALLHEVHHRVKNNLQVITSLLRLEAGRSQQVGTRAVLQEMQGRILAMALLHETLYRSDSFASVELAAYLKQLATQAFRAQSGHGLAVRLTFELAPLQVVMDQAAPCGLLVNELISNCLKHAFADGRAGEVQLRLQPAAAPGEWLLTVSDDGVGLPADFELRSKQSLGLQLVSDLVRQLGGTLHVSTTGGSTFGVTFLPTAIKV